MSEQKPASRASLRDLYNDFVERHEVAWELTIAAVVVAWIAVGFVGEGLPAASAAEFSLTLILASEFVTRLAASYDRRAYIRGHWIDGVALIPLPLIRGFRLLRLLRLLRLIRAFTGVYRALSKVERFASDKKLVWLFVTWAGFTVICSLAFYVAEVDVNPDINDISDALWWGIVTLTTVGYGDIFAVTDEGRLASSVLMVFGITLFAAITATITSRFVLDESGASTDAPGMLREVAALHDEGLLTNEEYEAKKSELLTRM